MNYRSDKIFPKVSELFGSGTWITYTDGSAIQHLHYLPFGEEQIDQRLSSFNSRYTFSAKEKDIETGYSYFGARYYNPDLSIWLSVDPMSDKYPNMTPYNYCNNNPVILVDPNGEEWETTEDADFAKNLIDNAKLKQQNYEEGSRDYNLLQEGIDGLEDMGKEVGQKYTFNKSSTGKGTVTKKENGTISMNYLEDKDYPELKEGSAWHEGIHLTRYNNWKKEGSNSSETTWGWEGNELSNNNSCNEEYKAFSSQMTFSPKSMPYLPTGQVDSSHGIKFYISTHYDKCKDSDIIFKMPK